MKMSDGLIQTRDAGMEKLLVTAENVAASRAPVLIEGASGSGKELLAKFIHQRSQRAGGPFIAVNCAAVPEGLLESELFGHEKGAFTGAVQRKIGRMEMAQGGTFLLDEVNEFPLHLQAKLLRVIQEGELDRLGGRESVRLNVRVIATSNKSLRDLVAAGRFREDLYYRLNVIRLSLPALKERPADIRHLAEFFVQVSSVLNNRSPKSLSPRALEKLMSWSWPGNVRELENVIERAVLMSRGPQIQDGDIELDPVAKERTEDAFMPGMTLSELEKQAILKTLNYTGNNRTQAAKMLGISIRTLRNKLNVYGEEKANV